MPPLAGPAQGMEAGLTELKRTILQELHVALGARMVPFAGYAMPVQYRAGVMQEHLHCREAASLFDVSHMGQLTVRPRSGRPEDAALALERVIAADVLGLAEGRQRYGLLTDAEGGILDDLMFARRADHFLVVVNAARKDHDLAHLRATIGAECEIEPLDDRALIALQGPAAEAALAYCVPEIRHLRFMDIDSFEWEDADLWVVRAGYTGEDGFEISLPVVRADALACALLQQPDVAPAGLGARDSLRLEAGLCLYGHDIDTTTTPVEADLAWAIQKVRRAGGARAGGFPGDGRILRELTQGPERRRVGLRPEGRAPMREGTPLFAEAEGGAAVGRITSGGYAPSLGAPVAMGYLPIGLCAPDTVVYGELRGKRLPVRVAELPFRSATYKR